MKAVAEIQVQPVGAGVSSRQEIQRAVEVLRGAGFETHTHALGTEVQGELSAIFEAIQQIHDALHEGGTPRIATQISIQTRTDEIPDLARSVEAIEGTTRSRPN
jgi:uncharacterized protein (TIGR00106 family)